MITEIAILKIKKGQGSEFEAAFAEAQPIIESMKGYIQHEFMKCMEEEDKYLLTVRWNTLEDHTTGFRQHPRYQEWKRLLHPFYAPGITVEHYTRIF